MTELKYATVLISLTVACATPTTIHAPVFLHKRIPTVLCSDQVKAYGIYRVIKDSTGKEREEFLSYCAPQIENYLSVSGKALGDAYPSAAK